MEISSLQPSLGSSLFPDLVPTKSIPETGSFADLIRKGLTEASELDRQGDQAVQDLALGRTDNVHGVMLTLAKADLTFRMLLEARNRLTESLQEILRMQV